MEFADWAGFQHRPWQAHTVDTNLEAKGTVLGMEHDAIAGYEFFRDPTEGIGKIGGDEPLDLFDPVYGANPIQTLVEYTNTKPPAGSESDRSQPALMRGVVNMN